MAKTWFITGVSKGFGREWAEAALERGDKVAATARNLETLEPLVATYGNAVLAMQLDVTDRAADFEAVKKAADHLGRLDVVVNNAGYGHFGAVEELSEDDVRSQLETNFFGALVGDAGRPPHFAGATLRPHHPGVEYRWRHRISNCRCLPRLEMGSGGFLSGSCAGSGGLRHKGDAH